LFKKIIKYIKILFPALCLSFSANATTGYYQTQGSNYDFVLMNNEFKISSLMNAVLNDDYKAASVFISSGANVNERNIANCTALHFASRKGNAKMIQLLLDNGARVNIKDDDGWTPLMRASMAGSAESIKLLIDHGAEIWYLNKWGETALVHSAISNCSKCAKILIDKTDLRQIENREPLKKQASEAKSIITKKYNTEFKKILEEFDIALNTRQASEKDMNIKAVAKPDKTTEIKEINLNEPAKTDKRKNLSTKPSSEKKTTYTKSDTKETEKIEEINLNRSNKIEREEFKRSRTIIPQKKPNTGQSSSNEPTRSYSQPISSRNTSNQNPPQLIPYRNIIPMKKIRGE